jgi:hypothetical protein
MVGATGASGPMGIGSPFGLHSGVTIARHRVRHLSPNGVLVLRLRNANSFHVRVHFVLRGFRYRGHRVSQTLALDSGDTTIAGRTTRTAKLTVSAANLKLVQQLGSLYSRLALTVRNDAGDSRKSAATFELQP